MLLEQMLVTFLFFMDNGIDEFLETILQGFGGAEICVRWDNPRLTEEARDRGREEAP